MVDLAKNRSVFLELQNQFDTRSVLELFRRGQSLQVFFSLEITPATQDNQCVNVKGQPLL